MQLQARQQPPSPLSERPFATAGKSIATSASSQPIMRGPGRSPGSAELQQEKERVRAYSTPMNLAPQPVAVKGMVPKLLPRLTGFHNTPVPVLIVYFLSPTEARILSRTDAFWSRILQHTIVWKGLHCRDFYSDGCGGNLPLAQRRCVWVQMEGRAARDKCLWHLRLRSPAEFATVSSRLTAIPGRTKDELLTAYRMWMRMRKLAAQGQATDAVVEDEEEASVSLGQDVPAWSKLPWKQRSRALGLPPGHARERPWTVALLDEAQAIGPALSTFPHPNSTVARVHALSYRQAFGVS